MEHLLLSLKPRYADLVFQRLKTAELRKRFIPSLENRDVFVYVSSPERRLRGGFRVGHVWHGTPEEVWNQVSKIAMVDKRDFDVYYAGQEIAYALQIRSVWEYVNPASLETLRNRFPDFVVPQSWRYVRLEECRSFRNMKKKPSPASKAA